MNRNSLLAIAVLAIVGACLGIVSAESVAQQSPAEDTFDGGAQKAIDITLSDSKVKDLINGKKYEILYVECQPSMSGQDTHAYVDIFLPDAPEDGSFIMVLVNLDEKTVTIIGDIRGATPEERQKAIDIALSNSKVKGLLDGKKYEIDYVDCMPSMNGQDTHAYVDIFLPDASEGDLNFIQVLVNMDEKKVVEVMPIADVFMSLPEPAPLTPEEEKQATDIALQNPTVKELLKDRVYNVSAFVFPMQMMENERLAVVEFYIPDMFANMSAYMTVDVNLNESVMEYPIMIGHTSQEFDSWSMSNDSVTG